jgi:hypothetical protein
MPKTARPLKRMFRDREDPKAAFASLMGQAHQADAEERWTDAKRLVRQALTIDPKSIRARVDMATLLVCHPETVDDIRESLRLSLAILDDLPGCVNAHLSLSTAHYKLGEYAEHARHFELAFRHLPKESKNYVGVRVERAGHWLEAGDYGRGWPEYDCWMNRKPDRRGRLALTAPWWRGEDLTGRTILIHSSLDGFGDAIQFIRYAPLVKARGGTVVLLCQPTLAHLLAECDGIDRVLAEGSQVPVEMARHDYHCPLMSLPAVLKTTLETVPDTVPYLSASAEAIERWRPSLEAIRGFKVGIAWQGNPGHQNDRFRSIALEQFAPLAEIPGVSLIPLQKGFGREQVASCGFPVVDLGDAYQAGDWMDSAAIVSQLDLVISPDSSIAHLGGALGHPTWVALPLPAEWRWMRDREDSPWYAGMRLFRQSVVGDWKPVFQRMAEALRQRLTGSP